LTPTHLASFSNRQLGEILLKDRGFGNGQGCKYGCKSLKEFHHQIGD